MSPRAFAIAAVAATLVLSQRTDAQVGSIINRAKKAAVDDATTKPAGSSAQLGDPFDAASLDAALKGMRVFKARLTTIASLRTQYLATQNRRQELENKNERAISEYNTNNSKIRDCMSTQINAAAAERNKDMQQRTMAVMTDPAKVQEYMAAVQAASNASMKGDTVAMKKANADMMKILGVDLKADTAAAVRRCGAPPAKPAAQIEMDRLEHTSDSLNVLIRGGESTAEIDAARAAGVTPARFAQMRERLQQAWNKPAAFPGKEGELIKAHKAEIEDLLKLPS